MCEALLLVTFLVTTETFVHNIWIVTTVNPSQRTEACPVKEKRTEEGRLVREEDCQAWPGIMQTGEPAGLF